MATRITPLARAHARTLATSAAATATTSGTAPAAAAAANRTAAFARRLDQGPSFDDFVGGEEIAQGTRVTMGNLKTCVFPGGSRFRSL